MTESLNNLLKEYESRTIVPPAHPTWLKDRFSPATAWIEGQLHDALSDAERVQLQQLEHSPDVQRSLNRLFDAARHACLLGGKRIRPLLVLLVGNMLGIQTATTLKGLCIATELIHAQSLVFDDLPCMDNDDLRRGKPTTHIAYDEATAVLVGDGLACFAYDALITYTPTCERVTPQHVLHIVKELGRVGSFGGLVNGQYADIYSHESEATLEHLQYIHANKTGALLRFAVMSPAWLLGKPDAILTPLDSWARTIGQLFQMIDDVLDATADSQTLGKTAGKDAEQNKLTYVSLLGLEGTTQAIKDLHADASAALDALELQGVSVDFLRDFQTYLTHRTF